MTPTAGSNFSRYVLPDDTDPDAICCVSVPVPDDAQWRAAFYGALWRLSLQTNWERDDEHLAKVVAARWREIYVEVVNSMGICTPSDNIIRTTIIANFRLQLMIEFELNGLDGIAPDRPDTFWDEDSGDAGDEIQQRDNALCNACLDYVNTVAEDLAAKIQAVSLFATPIIIPIAMSIAPVAGAIFVGALSVLELLTIQAINDTEIRRKVACCMYDNLQGVAITEANFNASLTGCGFDALSDEEIVRDMLEAGVNDTGNYLSFVNVLGSHFAAVGIEDIDCVCGLWTHTFDFEIENDGWVIRTAESRPYGDYVAAQGWTSEWAGPPQLPANDERLYVEKIGWSSRTIIRVQFFYTSTGTQGGSLRNRNFRLKLAGGSAAFEDFGNFTTPDVWIDQWDGSVSADEIELAVVGDSASDNSEVVLTKVVMTGEGLDPF